MLMMKSYPTKFKSFLWKIVQMGTLQKLQNSIQTLIIFWPFYPIYTNSLFGVIFVELPFCHFSPPNTSIHGKGSKIQSIFQLNILVFQTNGKQSYSFLVLSRFCNGLYKQIAGMKTNNRPFAAKPSRDLLFIKLWAATLRMPDMEKACQKHQNGKV